MLAETEMRAKRVSTGFGTRAIEDAAPRSVDASLAVAQDWVRRVRLLQARDLFFVEHDLLGGERVL